MVNLTVFQPAIAQPCLAIAIIGGGFSGSLVAVHLLRKATSPLVIYLIERSLEVGRGAAYSTPSACYLLNVPAGKMSAFPDRPEHFLNWLKQNGQEEATAATFVPRQVYGDYLQAILKEAQIKAPADVRLERIVDEAIALEIAPDSTKVSLRSGQTLSVQKVVLALGNLPSALPEPIAALENRDRYVRDGWLQEAIAQENPGDNILLVGTGLTMADVVVGLREQGFQGQIHAVSRHGLMPQCHKLSSPYPTFIDPETAPKTTRALLHRVRQEMRLAQGQGQDWRAVLDALRPITQQLWQALPLPEQKRFLRHVKAYWEVYRHRITGEIAELLDQARQSGQLVPHAGRIQTCRELGNRVEVMIQERGTQANLVLSVHRIVNCTGSNCDYSQLENPLLTSLQQQKLIRLSALALGIDTAPNGALIDTEGTISERLYTLGTPRKGNLWETTAVPEIRVQAAHLAQEILQSLTVEAGVTRQSAIAFQQPATFLGR